MRVGEYLKSRLLRMKCNQPYKDLYIYLFKGVLGENHEAGLGEAFLGNWVEADSSFLFFASPADEILGRLLKKYPELELIENYHFTYEQWQGGKPDRIEVENFVIVPPWGELDSGEGLNRIILDPGVVFGNGLHPTTRDCLRALACAARKRPFDRVLDFGTGTGILAVAAVLLGAVKVLAIDLNPLCGKTAERNVELNKLREKIQVAKGPAVNFFSEVADLVVANIHYDVIQEMLIRRRFLHGDRLIISGLMRSQAREVRAQLERLHINVIREWDYNMTWFTILAEIN
jgi:ribosomal protein L11 methyltransferase